MILLNEKEYAEKCLNNKYVGEKPFYTLTILAKYYYYYFNYRKKKITELLIDFMSKYYPRYDCNKSTWNDNIEKIAGNAGKYSLFEIDGVWITDKELETISNIHNKVLERLAFALLCIAKLNSIKNPNNNGWVNTCAKEIFSLARISCSVNERYCKLNMLYQSSLLELPKKNDNLNVRVTYMDNSGKNILFISDFRELGYEYLKYKGENFIRCRECGILIRDNKAGTKKYCRECSGYIPKEFKTIVCVDCEEDFEVDSLSRRIRCNSCYDIEKKRINRENQKKWKEKMKK